MPRWLLLALGISFATTASAAAWPHDGGDLAPDPACVFGALPNGLRYVVRPCGEPKGRVILSLLVRAGSLHERDDERGLAHFVEHMAFNGTRRFPRETLMGVLQRHGFAFGADVSAFTFPTHTVYELDVPAAQPGRLEEGLGVLREFADGQVFDPAEVERERGVIQSEVRARDSYGARSGRARLRFTHPIGPLARRDPGGDPGVVARADATALRQFYTTWYRADTMYVLAIGDRPAAELEALVRENFSTLPTPTEPPPPTPDLGWAGNPQSLTAELHTDAEAGAISTELISLHPGTGGHETPASREASTLRSLVFTLMNERLGRVRRESPLMFGAAGAATLDEGRLWTESVLRLDSSPVAWRDAVIALAREGRAAFERGFTAEELALLVRRTRRQYEYAIAAEPTATARTHAGRLAYALVHDEVFSTWAQRWTLLEPALVTLTPERTREIFRTAWLPGSPRLFMSGNLLLPNAPAQLAAAYDNGVNLALHPPPRPIVPTLDYTVAATPGAIRRRVHDSATDIEQVEFANGVRLNLKRTTFNADLVWVRARVGHGLAAQPRRRAGLGLLAATYLNDAGVARHLPEELRLVLAEHNLSLGMSAEEDAFVFSGGSDTRGADMLLRLLAAYLREPAWRQPEFAAAQRRLAATYNETDHEVTAALRAVANRIVYRDDLRFTLPDPAEIHRRTLDELLGWLEAELRDGGLEVGLVGDLDVEETIALAARTLGALPRRAARPAAKGTRPALVFNTQPGNWSAYAQSVVPRAAVRVQWPVQGCDDIHRHRVLEILAQLVQNRAHRDIREKLGATYDPSAEIWSGTDLHSDGFLILTCSASPADAPRIGQRLRELGNELATHGATTEDFDAALQPRLAENASRLRDNNYWLYYILAAAQEDPRRLTWPLTREADYRAMTVAQINALSREYLPTARAQSFIALPK